MNLSYWERSSWISNIDFTIVGSGIVGLNCAIQLKKKHPKSKILILEKGSLPQGASTKNAGFACFGSLSEILADLKNHSEEEMLRLVQERWNGIQSLRSLLGDHNIGYESLGGHELFLEKDAKLFQTCIDKIPAVNELLSPVFKGKAFSITKNKFSFKNIKEKYISHQYEGQIHTGMMMKALLALALSKGISIINATKVTAFEDNGSSVLVKTEDFEFKSKKLLIATNGFAYELLNENVKPARAQVIITKPIKKLPIKGTFHFDEGYYYFRNIEDRILFGGGRNLDFKTEETASFGSTAIIQNKLKEVLKTVILPDTSFEIEYGWSGVMGIGAQKKPMVKLISENVGCGVRLGGMGIAIGTAVGQQLAEIIR